MQATQQKKKITRPSKAKATPVVPVTEPVVQTTAAELVNSVATVVPTVASTPVVANEVAEVVSPAHVQTKTEKHKSVMIISAARVRRHLDKLNLNEGIDTQIAALKVHTVEFKTATDRLETKKVKFTLTQEVDGHKKLVASTRDATAEELAAAQKLVDEEGKNMPEYEMKIAAFSRERTRFSNNAPASLGLVLEELIKQLAVHTMQRANLSKKKIIQISHLHEAGVESLSLYPLVSSLPAFRTMANKIASENKSANDAKALAAVLAQAEKDLIKKYSVVVPKKKKAEPEANVEAEEPEAVVADAESDDDAKTSFKFYVQQVCDHLKKGNAEYEKIRVSTNLKSYLSELLVEFIRRFAGLVLITATSMKNKTVNELAVMRTVKALLTDGHLAQEKLELVECEVADPEFLKAELTRKEEAKANGTEFKSATAPMVRGLVCKRTISYPTCGYDALETVVEDKLKLYNADEESAEEASTQ